MATTSAPFSRAALKTRRPILPKPLMPIFRAAVEAKEFVAFESVGCRQTNFRGWTQAFPSKSFPTIPQWEGEITVHILDDTITEEAFEQHIVEAGKFIGIGSWRPRNNGDNGRFSVENIKWV